MDDVIYYYNHSVQGNFNTKESKIVLNDDNAVSSYF